MDRYAAFVSYRHASPDTQWADWLQHAIETYRIPAQATASPRIRSLGRVFVDRGELVATPRLSGELEAALERSDALIVVCSRQARESAWMNEEVRLFLADRRARLVLCLLIDGDVQQSVPPALLADGEPFAADVRPSGRATPRALRERARLQIVAALLGVGFDDLYRRDRRRRHRARMLGATLTVAILGALGALLLVAHERNALARQRRRDQLVEEARVHWLRGASDQALVKLAAAAEDGDASPDLAYLLARAYDDVRGTGKIVPAHAGPVEQLASAAGGAFLWSRGTDGRGAWDWRGNLLARFPAGDLLCVPDGTQGLVFGPDRTPQMCERFQFQGTLAHAPASMDTDGAYHWSIDPKCDSVALLRALPQATSRLEVWKLDGSAAAWTLAMDDAYDWVVEFDPKGCHLVARTIGTSAGKGSAAAPSSWKVWVLEAATSHIIARVDGGEPALGNAVLSPEHTRLAFAFRDGSCELRDASAEHTLAAWRGDQFNWPLAFSPDGACIVGALPGAAMRATCRAASDGHVLFEFDADSSEISEQMFRPDGRALFAVGAVASVHALPDGSELARLARREDEQSFARAVIAADWRTIALAAGPSVQVLRIGAKTPPARMKFPSEVTSLQLSRDGEQLAAGLDDGSIAITAWADADADPTAVLDVATLIVAGAQLAEPTRIATAGSDERVRIWNPEEDAPVEMEVELGELRSISVAPDRSAILVAGEKGAKLLSAPPDAHGAWDTVRWSVAGEQLAAATSEVLLGVSAPRLRGSFIAGGALAVLTSEWLAHAWVCDARTGAVTHALDATACTSPTRDLGESGDAAFGFSGPNGRLLAWCTSEDPAQRVSVAPDFSMVTSAQVRSILWIPTRQWLLVGQDDGVVQAFDRGSRLLWAGTPHRGPVLHLGVDSAGERLATAGCDGTCAVLSIVDGHELQRFDPAASGAVPELLLPVGGVEDEQAALYPHAVLEAVWSPRGDRVYTGGRYGSVCTWSAISGRLLATTEARGASVSWVASTLDGDELLVADFGGRMRRSRCGALDPGSPKWLEAVQKGRSMASGREASDR